MRVIIAHRSPGTPEREPPSGREPRPARPTSRRPGLRPARRLFLVAALLLCRGVTAAAADGPPVIISEPTSTRAVALTTPTFEPQPFPLNCAAAICQGQRTRVMLFVMGLALRPGDAASDVTARAEDGDRRFYDLAVEHVGPISGYGWMSVVIVKLGDDVGDVGDVLLAIKYRGAESNRVRLGLGHLGGGPADDAGAFPSPAPPFTLGGFARDGVAGLGGVSVAIGGAGVGPLSTGADGSFALGNLSAGGAYTLTPSKPCYSFSPAAFVVENLYRNTSVNFAGAENRIDGRVLDAASRPLAAVSIALGGSQPGAAQTGADGAFSFACLTPGDYTVTPAHALYNFAPASLSLAALAGPRAADFNATLKQFTIRGRITKPDGTVLAGVAVALSGSQTGATTTDASGDYALAGLRAGGTYTLTPSLAHHTFTPPARSFANLSGDATADLVGVLNTHAISGRVVNVADTGLPGVIVTLSGAQTATATTDAAGNYSFAALPAGGNYAVTPALANYTFAPSSRTFNNLSADHTADFTNALNAHAIRGRVASGAGGLAGAAVTLSGSRSAAATTDANGDYSFTDLPAAGSYTVTPALANYTFAPPARQFNNLSADQTADFAGVLNTHAIAGRVADAGNNPLAGVTVTLTGSQSAAAQTDAAGSYSFANLPAGGNYTVTPSRISHTFAPPARSFDALASNQTADFTATLDTFQIAGRVSGDANAPLSGVTVTLSGSRSATTTTGAGGDYSFTNLPAGGDYAVTPSLTHHTFAPAGRAFNALAANQTADFAGVLNTFGIGGRVADGANAPVAGATVALSGSHSATATTDAAGNYSFAALPAGGSYTVTLSKTHYTFAPASRAFNNLSAHQTGDFTATRNTHAIAGRIARGADNYLQGVSVTLSGAQTATAQTDAGGNYVFPALPAGFSYAVTPARANHTFAPASRVFDDLSADHTADFAATLDTHAIAGRVAGDGNAPLAGVTLTLGGSRAGATTTDAAGNYSFTNLDGGGDYTLTASLKHHSFSPPARAFNDLSSDQTADFAATFNSHAIRGRVLDEGGAGLSGVAVALGGTRAAATTTDAGGAYSFDALPAGGNYTIAASRHQYDIAPASRAYDDLASDQTADFAAALSRHTISGRVVTPEGSGVGGATVTLSGAQQTRTIQTAPDGRYAFAGVAARGNYTVSAARVNYDLGPANRVFNDLDADQTADFTGVLRRYSIRGRVTSGGQPLAAVHVALAGSQISSAIADAAGNFSFDVPAEGDYTVTPSPQHFYVYSPPAQSFAILSADASADFSATPVAPPATQHVLDWDGSPKTVDYNFFFNTPGDLGHFFWEFWAMPGANAGATYLLSDGYGGAHAVLFGFGSFDTTDPSRYQLIGNVWNGSTFVNFNSDEGPAVGEWGHLAVGWDGAEIVTYFNGVPVGRSAFAGPRREGGFGNGAGRLLVGGSDHNNLVGRIAQVRGFENGNPREASAGDSNASGVRAAFAPDTVFRTGGQMLSNYFEPRQTVPDISAGLAGVLHHGRLRGTPHPFGLLEFCESCPRPQYVIDPTAPDFATATDRSQRSFNPPPPPDGALAYDSFSRRNSTYVLGGAGGLGETEGGSAGRLPWQSAPATPAAAPFGILNERAVVLANRRALAWVALPPASLSTGHDLRVRRRTGTRAAGHDTGLAFRVADAANYFFAYTTGGNSAPNARALTVGYYLNGQRTELASGLSVAGGWTELRVVTTPAGAIRVYANSALVYSTTHGLLAGASGAGLYSDAPGLGLSNRWDNFTAYALPAP